MPGGGVLSWPGELLFQGGFVTMLGTVGSGVHVMKTIEFKITERVGREIDALVEQGWFHSRDKVVQEAFRRFLDAHRPELREQFVREDVEWGLRGGN